MDPAAAEFGRAGSAIENISIARFETFFPQAVKVAVGVDFTGIARFERSFRFFTRFQVVEVDATVIDQGNPFDIMLFFHGMGNGADVDFQVSIDFLESRYVFFLCCIDRAGDEMGQFLAIINDRFRSLSACEY